ncbi:hypothetical protein CBM2592_B40095 [Cupriavidus taiwanensis]|nr:hypothetical protein CBM2592_B40095 [Cupriavidus taiwanensis]SOY70635.1 hypothetical protein CBM2588_B30096 [Cupriavidus taiwanensis]SOZ91539.1 hypothetical protein CBM2622_B50009 [Cupriavidus taiwanensis]
MPAGGDRPIAVIDSSVCERLSLAGK